MKRTGSGPEKRVGSREGKGEVFYLMSFRKVSSVEWEGGEKGSLG